jgi:hypothetical protein
MSPLPSPLQKPCGKKYHTCSNSNKTYLPTKNVLLNKVRSQYAQQMITPNIYFKNHIKYEHEFNNNSITYIKDRRDT